MSSDAFGRGSLLWQQFGGQGEQFKQYSPCNGQEICCARLLSQAELEMLFRDVPPTPSASGAELKAFVLRLRSELESRRLFLRAAMQLETGFINSDCDELLEASFAYLEQFSSFWERHQPMEPPAIPYDVAGTERVIRQVRVAWGTVAIILPQNAFLLVAVTALCNALFTGNRVVLRAPLQSSRSALLLADALSTAQAPCDAASVVLCKAKEFVGAVCASPHATLLHYMGSSTHAPAILKQCFEGGKPAIADGAGNVWVYVGEKCEPQLVAGILAAGATRYNGQTCTSINGALIHPAIYEQVADALIAKFSEMRTGNPLDENVAIGALFDAAQADWCCEQMHGSGGKVVGGTLDGNYLSPAVVEQPNWGSALVREGLFGPALWISPGTPEEFVNLWPRNHFSLCAGVFSSENPEWWLQNLPNAARIVFNGDPSIEHIFEPWGGYAPSGANSVSIWHEKYTRVVSWDAAL